MMATYTIRHDNDFDFALWVYENSCLRNFDDVKIRSIPKSNSEDLVKRTFLDKNDFYIMCAIKYATPDIIIQKTDANGTKILFCSEFMTQTPQHDHVFQRFERIYCTSKLKIPVAFIFPGKKCKLEKNSGNIDYKKTYYQVNPLPVHTYLKTCKINSTPTLMFFWPHIDGFLKYDSVHETAPKIEGDILKRFNFLNYCVEHDGICPLETPFVNEHLNALNQSYPLKDGSLFLSKSYDSFIEQYKSFYNLSRVSIIDTNVAINQYGLDEQQLSSDFMSHDKTLIFSYSSKEVRETPYCGFLCGFYNLFCLDNEGNKKMNLIHAPNYGEYNGEYLGLTENISECPFENFENFNGTSFDDILNHHCIHYQSQINRIFSSVPDVNIIGTNIFYK